MANVIITKDNKRYVRKATGLLVTPYVYDEDDAKYYLGTDTYDIFAIVGDSISITQESGETDTLVNEFSSIPVIENVTMGKWNFRADCIDMQNTVLRELFSAKVAHDSNDYVEGAIAMPSDFRTVYCCIQILFGEGEPILVLPKVLMSSSLNISSLRTSVVKNTIQGTPLLTEICLPENETSVLKFINSDEETYTPLTPLVFIPSGKDFGVLHHKDVTTNLTYFSMYNSAEIVSVNIENGILTVVS